MLLSLRRLMLLIPLCAGFGVHAASIGEIDVSSHLGEPLRARVPISTDVASLPGEGCIRIVGPARRHPDLADAKLALVNRGGQNYISITTDKPVNSPVLDLTLQAEGCGLSMQKDFVILLSPQGLAPATPVHTSITAAVTAAEPVRPAPTAGTTTARHGTVKPHAQTSRKQATRFALKLDYGDGASGLLADNVTRLRQAGQPAAGQDTVPATTELPASQAAAGTPVSPGTTPHETSRPTAAAAAGQATPAIRTETTQPWYVRLLEPFNLLLLSLPILALLATVLWQKGRRQQDRYRHETTPPLNTLFPADQEIQLPQPPAPEPPAVKPAPVTPPPEPRPAPVEAVPPPPPARPPIETMTHTMGIVVPPIQTEDIQTDAQESFAHVMELAEVMLAFGRSGQAIETLSRHIHSNPRQAVDPWLKLLDLYHQSDLRAEFEALASDLHSHYNIAMPDWDGYAASPAADHEAGPLTLESLPHIMSRLTESWGSQDALDYLDKLLEDNRGGQRLGFSMALVRDILLLRDILRQICPGSAFPH